MHLREGMKERGHCVYVRVRVHVLALVCWGHTQCHLRLHNYKITCRQVANNAYFLSSFFCDSHLHKEEEECGDFIRNMHIEWHIRWHNICV